MHGWTAVKHKCRLPFQTLPLEGKSALIPAAVEKEGAEAELLKISGSAAKPLAGKTSELDLLVRCLELDAQARCEECNAAR